MLQKTKIILKQSFLFGLLVCLPFLLFGQHGENGQLSDKFAGIGVSIEIDSPISTPYIVEVLSGKPAAMAGLRSGDHILEINHWKTYKKDKDKVAGKLRGKVGSQVTLKIDRDGKVFDLAIQRQSITVNEQPVNFCESLDLMLKSASDTFSRIKGKMLNDSIQKGQVPDFVWESTLKMPKFSEAYVIKNYDAPAFFKAVYYIGKDSIQANTLYKRLLADVQNCMPYVCAESYQEKNGTSDNGYFESFVISQVKANAPKGIKGSTFIIKYEHVYGKPVEIQLIFSLPL